MATGRAADAPPPARDYGPSLPALLHRRFGVRERVTTVVALVLALLVTGGLLFRSYSTRPAQLVYRTGPVFNIQYSRKVMRRVAPKAGELVRLEARHGKLFASITVDRLRVPAYSGNMTSGLLPVYVDTYQRQLSSTEPEFMLRDEGNARVNSAQGYQVGFRSGPPGHFTWGRDMMLLPGDVNVRDGVLLRLRQAKVGTVNQHDINLLNSVRRAFKSFDFGTDRAKW
jgi:hypothetical protein